MRKITEMNVWFHAEPDFDEHEAAIKIMETFCVPGRTCTVSFNLNDTYFVDDELERKTPVLRPDYFDVSEVFTDQEVELSMAYMGGNLTLTLDNSSVRLPFTVNDNEARRIYNALGKLLAGAINRKP